MACRPRGVRLAETLFAPQQGPQSPLWTALWVSLWESPEALFTDGG